MGNTKKDTKAVQIRTVPFMTDIPEGTIALEINATIFEKGKMVNYQLQIDDSAIIHRQMLEGYQYDEEHEVRYELTDRVKKEGLNEKFRLC